MKAHSPIEFARLLLLGLPLALAACGDGPEGGDTNLANAASALAAAPLTPAERLAAATDQSWINLRGTVVTAGPNAFVLDYGAGEITVEMDDWDWYREGSALLPGDSVVVTGKVDDDLWQAKRIEAGSVYVKKLDTYFYASGADEEELQESTVYVASGPTYSDTTGYVTAAEGQELTVNSGAGEVRVDLTRLKGKQKQPVKVGERVYVWGDLDVESGERTEIMARGIVRLAKDRTKLTGSTTPPNASTAAAAAAEGNSAARNETR